MAKTPSNTYPLDTTAPDAGFPYGSGRDVSGPITGTPRKKEYEDDLEAFKQAAFLQSGVTPSESTDTAINSQWFESLKKVTGFKFKSVDALIANDVALAIGATTDTTAFFAPASGDTARGGAGWTVVATGGTPSGTVTSLPQNRRVTDQAGNVWQQVIGFILENTAQRNVALNSDIDNSVDASWCAGGTPSFPNFVGVNNKAPLFPAGRYAPDTGYTAGVAGESAVIAGYDNIANALASLIASQHSIVYTGADHSSIFGGSINAIGAGSLYSGLFSCTQTEIEDDFTSYSFAASCDQCTLGSGASVDDSAFRTSLLTSTLTTTHARNSLFFGCSGSTIQGSALYSAGSVRDSTIGISYSYIQGSNLTLATGSRNLVIGDDIDMTGASDAIVSGTGHTVNWPQSAASGRNCIVPYQGMRVHSSRQRGSTAGANQSLEFNCNNETTDGSTVVYLSCAGSSGYPRQPENSIVDGTFYLIGVDQSTGDVYSSEIAVTTKRIGAANPVAAHVANTAKSAELTPANTPTVNTTSNGIYRVRVVGEAGKNIAWDASFVGHQVVYA